MQYGLNLNGWSLFDARGISADGKVIAGCGFDPQGYQEGWVVDLGVTCSDIRKIAARCLANGTLRVIVRLRNTLHDGETMTVEVDGVPFAVNISGDVAKLDLPNEPGAHTIELVDPADCKDPIGVDCG